MNAPRAASVAAASPPSTATAPRPSTTGSIVVSNVRVTEAAGDRVVLAADVRGALRDVPECLWFEMPAALRNVVGATGDAFLPVLLIRAMRDQRALVLEDTVSARLLGTLPGLMAMLSSGSRHAIDGLRPVAVRAEPRERQGRGRAVATMFSGGVDSLYAVARNAAQYASGDSRRITHLVLVHGMDVPVANRALFEMAEQAADRVADRMGTSLITVRTNVRDFVRDLDWVRAGYGPCLISTALALSPLWHTCFLAGAYAFWELQQSSSHPLMDPLWSTELTEFAHVGGEATRADRVAYLARFPAALEYLRVCWKNPGDAYNCGQCEKCLRTMLELHLAEALGHARLLPQRIEPERVASLAFGPAAIPFWEGLLAQLRATGRDAELASAVEKALLRHRWGKTRLARLDARVWAAIGRLGLTPRRAKTLDRYLLGGTASAAFRAVESWTARRGRR